MNTHPPLRFGYLLPTRGIFLYPGQLPDPEDLVDLAQTAESNGFDSLWVGDSLTAKPRLEPLATLAAVGMRTKTINLGTAVLLAALRNPVLLAQTVSTIDFLTNGRVLLGIGAGGAFNEAQRNEWMAAGVSPESRGARLTEIMQLCRRLWTEETVSFHGQFYKAIDVRLAHRPSTTDRIPILLACHYQTGTERQYARAASYADGIISISDTPQEFNATLDYVQNTNVPIKDKRRHTKNVFYMTINIDDDHLTAKTEADKFIISYYGQNYWKENWGPFGNAEEIASKIIEYQHAGATEIVIRFASANQRTQLARFVSQVYPLTQAKRPY